MATTGNLSRRMFLAGACGTIAVTLLAACGEPPSPAASGGTNAAPAATSGSRKAVIFWGRQQFLPESNDYLTESVKLASQKGGFDVTTPIDNRLVEPENALHGIADDDRLQHISERGNHRVLTERAVLILVDKDSVVRGRHDVRA